LSNDRRIKITKKEGINIGTDCREKNILCEEGETKGRHRGERPRERGSGETEDEKQRRDTH
jgi:hypothetical protein